MQTPPSGTNMIRLIDYLGGKNTTDTFAANVGRPSRQSCNATFEQCNAGFAYSTYLVEWRAYHTTATITQQSMRVLYVTAVWASAA